MVTRACAGRLLIFLAVACGWLASPAAAGAHPLHTSLAELSYDSRSGRLAVSLRVFVDDFTTASARRRQILASRGGSSRQSPLVDYALESLGIADASGRRIALQPCGGRRVGDLMWLCFSGIAPRGSRLRVTNRVLFDLYRDQINIVKAVADGRTTNLLFVPGDGAKWL